MDFVPTTREILRSHESADDISHEKGELTGDVATSLPDPSVQEVLYILDYFRVLLNETDLEAEPLRWVEASADNPLFKAAATADAMYREAMNPEDPIVVDEADLNSLIHQTDAAVRVLKFGLRVWRQEAAT